MLLLNACKLNYMATYADRLKWAMDQKEVGPSDLARACGIKPQAISQQLSGESKSASAKNLLCIARILNVNAEWLAAGTGSPSVIEERTTLTHPLAPPPPTPDQMKTKERVSKLAPKELAQARMLLRRASPNSQRKLSDIIHKAESGQLNDQDIDSLHQMAERLAEKGK
jgi:transcriptional regulator with XRE-family HTH domain